MTQIQAKERLRRVGRLAEFAGSIEIIDIFFAIIGKKCVYLHPYAFLKMRTLTLESII